MVKWIDILDGRKTQTRRSRNYYFTDGEVDQNIVENMIGVRKGLEITTSPMVKWISEMGSEYRE